MNEVQERKVTINDDEYNYNELAQEQQILVEHIENCRRQKAQIAFQMDRENVAEGAFAKMLTESFEKKDEEVKEKKEFTGSPKDA
jgi:hypothetical protein